MRTPAALKRLIARTKPLVPEAAWPRLLEVSSWAGSRPLVGPPRLRSVLVVAPHPDDEAIGAGGTVRLLADAGARVRVLFATDGEATRGSPDGGVVVAARRRGEAEGSCRLLGAEADFAGMADGNLAQHTEELGRRVGEAARAQQADGVFVPWFGDGHPDHLAASRSLRWAGLAAEVEVWGYETWTPLVPNRIVDVTRAFRAKEAAVAVHQTAHLAFDVGATLGLNRYRSVHGLMGRGYAEAFMAAPVGEYLAALARAGLG